MIGVVAALRTEIRGFSHDRVRLTVSGVGEKKARRAAERLCSEVPLSLLVSAGFCGAVDASLKTGDLVVGGARDEGKRFAGDPRACGLVADARPGDSWLVPAVRRDPRDCPGSAIVVDMESAAVGEVALRREIPFLMLRAVLDTPDDPLASSYTWRLAFQPWVWPRVLHDARRAKVAAASLRRGLEMLAVRYCEG